MHRLAALENRVRQLESGFNNELEVEDSIQCSLAPAFGSVVSDVRVVPGGADRSEISETIQLELTTMFGEISEEGTTE